MTRTDSQALVTPDGDVQFGRFPATLEKVNGRDAAHFTPMGLNASRLQRHFQYKQFQYFGVISDELLVGCAFADTAWIGLAFAYIFNTRTGELQEHTWRSPLARQLHMSDSPTEGVSRFENRAVTIELGYRREGNGLKKTLSLKSAEMDIDASMIESEAFEPMSLCTRIGINGWAYANKVAAVPVTGRVRGKHGEWDLAELNASGHHDFSAGYMRRETFWNWACSSAQVGEHRIGWNLSCGVNETSTTENCLWLDDKLIKVNLVQFGYDRRDLMKAWSIRSDDGIVELTFEPLGRHREHLDLRLFASNFNQLFGRFHGTLVLPDGQRIPINNVNGFVEEQYAKW